MRYGDYHSEVLEALKVVGRPEFSAIVQADRKSQLQYLAIRAADLRKVLKQGFSFYELDDRQILDVWDDLWQSSPYYDVMNAGLGYYGPRLKKQTEPMYWDVLSGWSARVENWAHADGLSGIYSRLLESYPKSVYPQLQRWNKTDDQWLRRLSLVSLIHYTGKNAVFLPPGKVLPLVKNCVEDDRYFVQKAVGWVLREMGHVYPAEIRRFIETHCAAMGSVSFSRAIERREAAERSELRAIRKAKKAG
ncbi:MAG: DNA alkylation repair protein [Gemmatimonadetes bacterium]|jgi:3-methyladenine DNA glycosylase AlkD|nr:DNA alkylation repair protein [Gemmatimonadota bacterium]MBT5141324.1 DNA alkylation repair protein [Gemmatimonadota bacterium]MBT5590405.1 DNA alkylation repair protein [Gemmatimonadota bacterium]MBT5964242.1 DNA alkylation repair protein [Gemmatimonadota bacterium]MBT6627628.1 DNA alkylation repair protein [Gemmatimonadota bacterium]